MKGSILAVLAGQALATTPHANVSFVTDTKWVYDDAGTGSSMNINVQLPTPTNIVDEYVVGSIALDSGYDKKNKIAVMESQIGLADAVSFTWLWDDKGTEGDHAVTFVRPVCPSGYSSVSDFAIPGYCTSNDCIPLFQQLQAQTKISIKPCIMDSMLLDCAQDKAPLVWNDHRSGSDNDVSVFALVGPPGHTADGFGAAANTGNKQGFWRARGDYSPTLGGTFKCLNPSVFVESLWSSTAKWGPGVNGQQTFVSGSTWQSSQSRTKSEKSTLAASLSVSVGGGFYGVDLKSELKVSSEYTTETSQTFSTAASKSETENCVAPTCEKYNYTTNELRIYQWVLDAKKVEGTAYLSDEVQVTTCIFFCGTNRIQPRCPPSACSDDNCQECCMSNGSVVPCSTKSSVLQLAITNPTTSATFGVHAN
mmetsp:Transcript_6093/g.10408  ORF Transcript_6093/g.10408 Transcript_6093/m.10408 type:complete len:422 (-) Transcript_6093:832-2097(-)